MRKKNKKKNAFPEIQIFHFNKLQETSYNVCKSYILYLVSWKEAEWSLYQCTLLYFVVFCCPISVMKKEVILQKDG